MSSKSTKSGQDTVVLNRVMKATGLSEREARELLMMSDDDLDTLCDTALSDVAGPTKVAPLIK